MKKIIEKYLRPFWFSHKCDHIKVPYFYGSVLMLILFSSVIVFLVMAWKHYDPGILGSTAAVIATLGGLYFGTLKLFNDGNKENGENNAKVDI